MEEIRNMILEMCKGKEWGWELHIRAVVKYSIMLAKELNANQEVCELAAWLHDIRKIKGDDEMHHLKGAEDAQAILEKYRYDQKLIDEVKECIITHSSDKNYSPKTLEAKIVASADALSYFDYFYLVAHIAYVRKKLSIEEGRIWILKKYASAWKKISLLPQAQEIARPRYES